MRAAMSLLIPVFFMWATAGIAKEIMLAPGETIQVDDVTVRCGPTDKTAPLSIKECQYWDEYDKRCLYEKTILVLHDKECVEQCQHWDEYEKKCLFASTCSFEATQRLFVRTECMDFDRYAGKCVKTGNKIVR